MRGDYRYTLTRDLGLPDPRRLCWVMLNPSTADETVDDPTIRRVKRFTTDAGFGRLIVVNLFALRSTKPAGLLDHPDPIGPENADIISAAFRTSDDVVFAWGAWLSNTPAAGRLVRLNVALLAQNAGHVPKCLGRTKAGMPKHPLYVPATTPFVPYDEEERDEG